MFFIDPDGMAPIGSLASYGFKDFSDSFAEVERREESESSESSENSENDPPDYFDKDTGEYLGKGDTDEIRFISKKDWNDGKLQNYSRSPNNSKVEAMIYLYYAEKYDLIPQNAKGAMFCCKNINGWSTSHQDGILTFNFERNSIGLGVLNRFDAINVLVHEFGSHGIDHLNGIEYIRGVNDHLWEYRATRAEINHWSWHDTSKTYKIDSYKYYGRYLTKPEIKNFYKKYEADK